MYQNEAQLFLSTKLYLICLWYVCRCMVSNA